ncbi:competence/damage-inducible protein A [Brevibacillus marinus]|uniref:competence/damage-inducible protein A n=1 Tax=Brevibacillus marinus TaxID=2496837 RepID=UPI000F83CC47|nr:competence/damage-inducible protein A [Brevibacillus marinus]
MRAELIAVGTELLLGQIANTNAQFLSQRLAALGINVYFHTVVGDNDERLLFVTRQAAERSDLVIFTGGLGPTQDDLTKETVAAHLGLPLVTDEEAMRRIAAFFERRGIKMSENNRKQALVIEGCTVFPNDRGMAPGMALTRDGTTYVLLPGPPSELNPMFDRYVFPFLSRLLPARQVFHSRVLRFFGIGESALEERLLDLIEQQTNPTIAPYAKDFEVTLRITARADSVEAAEQLIAPVEAQIRSRVGEYIYGEGETQLHEVFVQALRRQQVTVACAESCTGGALSALITSVPGSSAAFRGGIVCYSNEVKQKLLGIPAEVLAQDGAVSESVARLLAEHVRLSCDATVGIALTGVAGPDPLEGKPVGLVYLGIAVQGLPVLVKQLNLAGHREAIIGRAAKAAMFHTLQRLKER